jgi:hypothetical protein
MALEFFLALIFAAFIALLLAAALGRGARRGGGWQALAMLILLLFLAIWAGGVYMAPLGPALMGVSWLPFLAMAVFLALLIAALLPPSGQETPAAEGNAAREAPAPASAAVAIVGVFFWILVAALVVAIVAHYIWLSE